MSDIYFELTAGGSGYGITYYLKYLRCPKSVTLYDAARALGPPGKSDSDWNTCVGTLVHAFLQLYYTRAEPFSVRDVIFVNQDGELDMWPWRQRIHWKMRVEAEDYFNAYRMQFPDRKEFGKTHVCEFALPRDDDDKAKLDKAIGLDPFTCRLDRVALFTHKACAKVATSRGISIEPGLWLQDHKTAGRITELTYDMHRESIQFAAYMLALNAIGIRVNGTLVNVIEKSKPVKFHTYVVPYPNRYETVRFHHTVAVINGLRRSHSMPNVTSCFFPRTCVFHKSGTCNKLWEKQRGL